MSQGRFELLSHEYDSGNGDNVFLINSGVAYDGYGNRLYCADRTRVTLSFTTSPMYLCVRRRAGYRLIDYQEHPYYGLPKPTKYDVEIEFYLANGVIAVDFGAGSVAYYPPLDSDNVIEGLVLAKVFQNAGTKPDNSFRSPLLAVRDGTFFNLQGFNLA